MNDYADCSPLDWVLYEFGTICYDYQIHPEATKRIEEMFKWLDNHHPIWDNI